MPYTFSQEMRSDSLALKGGIAHFHFSLWGNILLAVSICLRHVFNTVLAINLMIYCMSFRHASVWFFQILKIFTNSIYTKVV